LSDGKQKQNKPKERREKFEVVMRWNPAAKEAPAKIRDQS
jgi:hypothetical protein